MLQSPKWLIENNDRKGNQHPTKHIFDETAPSLIDSTLFREKLEGLGLYQLPWQWTVMRDCFAVNDKNAPLYRVIGLSLPRQQGKSEVIIKYMLARAIYFGSKGAYTSYEKESAWTIYDRAIELIKSNPRLARYFPKLPTVGLKNDLKDLVAVNPRTGEKLGRLSFHTRKGGTGRGKGYEFVVIDEAQELTAAQYDAFAGTMLAKRNGQILFVGTPSSFETSATFGAGANQSKGGHFFIQTRAKILNGETKHAAWLEWGVDKIHSKDDLEAWYRVMPSLGYSFAGGKTAITIEAIESHVGDDESFNTEWLGYWSSQSKARAIDITRWRDLKTDKKNDKINSKSYLALSIKSSFTQSHVYVAVAVRRSDEKVFTEIVKTFDTSSAWTEELYKLLVPYLRNSACTAVYIDGELAKTALVQKMSENGAWRTNGSPYRQGKTMLVAPKDISSSCASLITSIYERRLVHGSQYVVDAAVEDAKKRTFRGNSDSFGFESMSGMVDVTPLETVALAVNGVLKNSRASTNPDQTDISDGGNELRAEAGGFKVKAGFGAFAT